MASKSAVCTLIQNVRLIDRSGVSGIGSILFTSGGGRSEILALGPGVKPDESIMKNCWVYNGRHYYACLGFTDLSVHICEPGEMSRETLRQTANAANKGGVTAVLAIHDLVGGTRNAADEIIKYVRSATTGYPCTFIPSARLYQNDPAESLPYDSTDAIYAAPPYDDDVLFKVMTVCTERGKTLFMKCASPADGALYRPNLSSLKADCVAAYKHDSRLAGALIMAEKSGCRLHVSAIGTESQTELIKIAKSRGVRVTCDSCPQYFTFNDSDIFFYGTSIKLCPPLASESDRKAIIGSLADGTIDCISSDHTPYSKTDRNNRSLPFSDAGCGMIGLQTLFAASYSALVKPEGSVISLEKLISLLSSAPAAILGRETSLRVGGSADITVFTTEDECVFSPAENASGQSNTPFFMKFLTGNAVKTFSNGISLS